MKVYVERCLTHTHFRIITTTKYIDELYIIINSGEQKDVVDASIFSFFFFLLNEEKKNLRHQYYAKTKSVFVWPVIQL